MFCFVETIRRILHGDIGNDYQPQHFGLRASGSSRNAVLSVLSTLGHNLFTLAPRALLCWYACDSRRRCDFIAPTQPIHNNKIEREREIKIDLASRSSYLHGSPEHNPPCNGRAESTGNHAGQGTTRCAGRGPEEMSKKIRFSVFGFSQPRTETMRLRPQETIHNSWKALSKVIK